MLDSEANDKTNKPSSTGGHHPQKPSNVTRHELTEKAARLILESAGEDLTREGLKRTPQRFAKAFDHLLTGYGKLPSEIVGAGIFDAEGQSLVVVQNIEFYSMCEHHILPFWGTATVAYYPDKKILGLSKIPRILELFSRRLQVQERLTEQVADALAGLISPRAVAVQVRAQHLCMMMRGVEKQNSHTLTETFRNADSLTEFERNRLIASLAAPQA